MNQDRCHFILHQLSNSSIALLLNQPQSTILRSLCNMAQSTHDGRYFTFVLTWLKVFAVPIEPLNMSWFEKILYTIYSILFLVLFPMGFLVSQICELPNSLNNLKRLMFGMGYIFSDSLGKTTINN